MNKKIFYWLIVIAIIIVIVLLLHQKQQTQKYQEAENISDFISVHLTMGNPSDADTASNNYLMIKPQYVLSYNNKNKIPNWVAWHLEKKYLGSVKRKDDFRPDTSLPFGFDKVKSSDYAKSGYARGHMCPSADRTDTKENNAATFLMTNIIPQATNNNSGPWAKLENYCRELVKKGKELYIYSGGYGNIGFIKDKILIPAKTWKIILVLDYGNEDLKRVTSDTRVIAVVMPNCNKEINRNDHWKNFITCVDSIEFYTGYDFFSNVHISVQSVIESKVDNN